MKKVLITGASGNIGQKLTKAWGNKYNLCLLDLRHNNGVMSADLTKFDPSWSNHFDNVDTVVHLAGEMRPDASCNRCYDGNVVCMRNILSAAKSARVRRVIFASTNQIMAGYRFLDIPVLHDSEPKPLNPYAISKLICEELGKSFAQETGASFIAFRIGYLQAGENTPHPSMGIGLWGQEMWLSNNDVVRAFELGIESDGTTFEVLNLVSNNKGSRWDMEQTTLSLGFVARDHYTPTLSVKDRDDDERARAARLVPGFWLDQYFNQLG